MMKNTDGNIIRNAFKSAMVTTSFPSSAVDRRPVRRADNLIGAKMASIMLSFICFVFYRPKNKILTSLEMRK